MTKEEKERQYYNQKLLKEGVRNELKMPHRINWIELIANCIGIFIGLRIIHLTGLEAHIANSVLSFLVQAAVIAVCMYAVQLTVNALCRLFGKKQKQNG